MFRGKGPGYANAEISGGCKKEALIVLGVTDNAAQAIGHLLEDRPGAGLRIGPDHTDSDQLHLGLAISDGPQHGDEVIQDEGEGWRIFVDQEIAPELDQRILDARIDEDQALQFSLVQP
jgi:iron-sulfur cluster assembly protein